MSSIEQLTDKIPDFAKHARLNLTSLVADETLSPQRRTADVSSEAIQTAVRFSAIVQSVAVAIEADGPISSQATG
ncbi:hypothetical protein ABIB82_007262 [Bradyrhizobium sp. i1.8.4]